MAAVRRCVSYGQSIGEPADPGVVPESHIAFLGALPLLHTDAHRVYVHAAVDPLRPLDDQDPEILLWYRYAPGDWRGHGDRHVVHGHHPFADGPHSFGDRTDLDTLAWQTGRLVVGVFDDARPRRADRTARGAGAAAALTRAFVYASVGLAR